MRKIYLNWLLVCCYGFIVSMVGVYFAQGKGIVEFPFAFAFSFGVMIIPLLYLFLTTKY